MARAGEALWAFVQAHWPGCSLTVVCGAGNNGGDGYVLAKLAAAAGLAVQVVAAREVQALQGDAAAAAQAWLATGAEVDSMHVPLRGQLLVDGLLGSGLQGAVEGEWADLIRRMNATGRPILAIDVPSGLNADTGEVQGVAVRAAATLSFVGRKLGLHVGQAADHCGQVVFESLGLPDACHAGMVPAARLMTSGPRLSARAATVHKGQLGHVLVIAGDQGMGGAAQLAGWAALRAGAGLVSVATHPDHAAQISAACPELMVHGVTQPNALTPWLARADVLAMGPGLGQSSWSRDLFTFVLAEQGQHQRPWVLDADALNLLAALPADQVSQLGRAAVLTPHVGEAARLLAVDRAEILADRCAAALKLAQRHGAVCVLKGRGTVVAEPNGACWVCDRGHSAMATAGMGDALTGLLASILAQFAGQVFDAAAAAVWLHAVAGEQAATGRRQISVRELIEQLPLLMQGQST